MTITPKTHKYNHCDHCHRKTPTIIQLHKPARDVENGHIHQSDIDLCATCLQHALNLIQQTTPHNHQTTITFNTPTFNHKTQEINQT